MIEFDPVVFNFKIFSGNITKSVTSYQSAQTKSEKISYITIQVGLNPQYDSSIQTNVRFKMSVTFDCWNVLYLDLWVNPFLKIQR